LRLGALGGDHDSDAGCHPHLLPKRGEEPMSGRGVAAEGTRPSGLTERLLGVNAWLVFAFFYLPIVVLVIYSFNDSQRVGIWGGFTFRWYSEMFQNAAVMSALWN